MHAGESWFIGAGQRFFLGGTAVLETIVRSSLSKPGASLPPPVVVINKLHLHVS